MRTTVQTWCEDHGWEARGESAHSTQTCGEITAYMLVWPFHVWRQEEAFGTGSSATARGRYTVERVG